MRREPFDQYEPFLCHYTSRYAALAHVLPLRLLRFSPFEMMRDPLEAKDRYVGVNPGPGFLGPKYQMYESGHRDINAAVNRILKWEFKLLSMTADPRDPRKAGDGHFGRGYARPRMWEQYAEGHRGVCLLFSYDGLAKTVEAQLQGLPWSKHELVRYRSMTGGLCPDPHIDFEELQRGTLEALSEEIVATLVPDLFFEKYDDYASEQEYRFVARSPEETFLNVQFGDCLKGVVLGAEFPPPEFRPLLFQCAELGAALLRMSWRQGLGQIEGFYNPTIPLEHNHDKAINPFRDELAQWHPTLAEYESGTGQSA